MPVVPRSRAAQTHPHLRRQPYTHALTDALAHAHALGDTLTDVLTHQCLQNTEGENIGHNGLTYGFGSQSSFNYPLGFSVSIANSYELWMGESHTDPDPVQVYTAICDVVRQYRYRAVAAEEEEGSSTLSRPRTTATQSSSSSSLE
jgi:hypothetical protein